MTPRDSINRTDVDRTHPCYEIDRVSSTLTRTPSILCALLYTFLSSISVLIVCGNFLVIISIIFFKQLHTPTNCLILSLAVADLLVGFLVFPLNMEFSPTMCLYYANVYCKIRQSLAVALSAASIFNLCCISIDRYYAVCQPLTYQVKINVHVVVIMIVVSWSISIVIAAGYLFTGLISNCQENCYIGAIYFFFLGPVLSFFLPTITILSIYLRIFLIAQDQAHSIQNTTCQSTKSGATVKKVDIKATRTLAIVMGVFLMCWLPFFLYFLSELFSNSPVPIAVFETVTWLALFNSLLNPCIYAFFYSWFRSAFKIILAGKICQKDFSQTKLL